MNTFALTSALTLTGVMSGAASAAVLTDLTPTGDTIRGKVQAGSTSYQSDNDFAFRIGEGGSTNRAVSNNVLGFTLPNLPTGDSIDSVVLSFTVDSLDDNGELGDLVVTLLDTANPDALGTALFTESSAPGGTNETVGSTDSTGVKAFTLTGDALDLFESFYGGDETPDQSEVFFRLNNDTELTLGGGIDRYSLAPGTSGGQIVGSLTVTTIPEPGSLALIGIGGLLLVGRRRTA